VAALAPNARHACRSPEPLVGPVAARANEPAHPVLVCHLKNSALVPGYNLQGDGQGIDVRLDRGLVGGTLDRLDAQLPHLRQRDIGRGVAGAVAIYQVMELLLETSKGVLNHLLEVAAVCGQGHAHKPCRGADAGVLALDPEIMGVAVVERPDGFEMHILSCHHLLQLLTEAVHHITKLVRCRRLRLLPLLRLQTGKERLPDQIADWMLESLQGGRNSSIVVDAERIAWLLSNGTATELGHTAQGLQLDFLLSCGEHVRRCTPNALREQTQLLCRFCTTERRLRKARRDRPSKNERAVYILLTKLGSVRDWRWQYRPLLPGWPPKTVDFWHARLNVYMEVDGRQHFYGGMHCVPSDEQQQKDIQTIIALWQAGAALVRVHYADLAGDAAGARVAVRTAISYRAINGTRPLLVLSPSYTPGPMVASDRVLEPWYFITSIGDRLEMAQRVIDDYGCITFM
jgi:hypothetical protein